MTFRVYLREGQKTVTHKTTTESEEVARFAFDLLKQKTELRGQKVSASITQDGHNVAYYDFETQREWANGKLKT